MENSAGARQARLLDRLERGDHAGGNCRGVVDYWSEQRGNQKYPRPMHRHRRAGTGRQDLGRARQGVGCCWRDNIRYAAPDCEKPIYMMEVHIPRTAA